MPHYEIVGPVQPHTDYTSAIIINDEVYGLGDTVEMSSEQAKALSVTIELNKVGAPAADDKN